MALGPPYCVNDWQMLLRLDCLCWLCLLTPGNQVVCSVATGACHTGAEACLPAVCPLLLCLAVKSLACTGTLRSLVVDNEIISVPTSKAKEISGKHGAQQTI